MFPRPIPATAIGLRRLYMCALIVVLLIWLAPLLAVILTSMRSYDDIAAGNMWGVPTKFALIENYTAVFTRSKLHSYFVNSLIITLPSVLAVIVLSVCAGFVLAKYKFPGNMPLFAIFIAGNFLPSQIMMIPVRDLMLSLGIYNTFWALILFHVAFQTGFATLFMRNFIAALPDELFQAAKVDGASAFQVLKSIVFPLILPGIAALSILLFTFIWNDYFWALVLSVDDSVKPVTAGLANLKGEFATEWNLVSAGAIVVALPSVVMFFVMQRYFIAGLTKGAVKG